MDLDLPPRENKNIKFSSFILSFFLEKGPHWMRVEFCTRSMALHLEVVKDIPNPRFMSFIHIRQNAWNEESVPIIQTF